MRLKLIFFPLTLIVSVTILIWVAKPEWESLKANKQALQTLNERMEKFQKNQQNMQKALTDFNNLEETDRQLILNAIPFLGNNDDFIAEIYKNVQQAGAFLVGTDLKSNQRNSDEEARKRCLQEKAASASSATEGAVVEQAVYCPVAKKVTTANVEIVGSYANAKEFARTVDQQNRLSLPSKLTFEKLQNSTEAGVAPGGNVIKASVAFDFYDKEQDKGVKLSSLFDTNDKVLNSLMTGAINKQAIAAFKDSITSEVFRPVTVQEMGKADIFAQ